MDLLEMPLKSGQERRGGREKEKRIKEEYHA